MLEKIVSGGQTGADRAALDFATENGIPHGGWCPKGRMAEDGPLDIRYQLQETPNRSYPQRTEWNVRDSDGTVVFSIAPVLTGGSKKTVFLAHKLGKPVLRISRDGGPDSPEAELLQFVDRHGIKVLNVAGPRASNEAKVYGFVQEVLTKALAEAQAAKSVRLLVSEREPCFAELIEAVAGQVAHGKVTILTPPSANERDLLELAAAQEWNLAILFANNVHYESGDRSPQGLERDAARLVERLVRDFKKPLIVLYGYPDLATFPLRLREAGALAVLRAPFSLDDLKAAVEAACQEGSGEHLRSSP